MFARCFLDFSVCVGAFVIGLSQISFFFSLSQGQCRAQFWLNCITNHFGLYTAWQSINVDRSH